MCDKGQIVSSIGEIVRERMSWLDDSVIEELKVNDMITLFSIMIDHTPINGYNVDLVSEVTGYSRNVLLNLQKSYTDYINSEQKTCCCSDCQCTND